jgi:hypothetical protein
VFPLTVLAGGSRLPRVFQVSRYFGAQYSEYVHSQMSSGMRLGKDLFGFGPFRKRLPSSRYFVHDLYLAVLETHHTPARLLGAGSKAWKCSPERGS